MVEFVLTSGNADDIKPLRNNSFNDKIYGKIFGGKVYLQNDLFDKLFIHGILLITKLRKNIKKSNGLFG
jgi:hypothetical protein